MYDMHFISSIVSQRLVFSLSLQVKDRSFCHHSSTVLNSLASSTAQRVMLECDPAGLFLSYSSYVEVLMKAFSIADLE